MGVNCRSYWWVSCDGADGTIDGCPAGDNSDDSESDYDAEQWALNHGWLHKDGRWLCPDHQQSSLGVRP
jgi:hypothetical protein